MNSIRESARNTLYSIKSLGKSHKVKTLAQLGEMSVADIDALDPSDVSKILLDKTKKPKHQKSMTKEKSAALFQLAHDKKTIPKRNSRKEAARREREIGLRNTRSARNAQKNKAVERLLAMATDQHAIDEYTKMPSAPTKRVRGGKRTRRRKIKN